MATVRGGCDDRYGVSSHLPYSTTSIENPKNNLRKRLELGGKRNKETFDSYKEKLGAKVCISIPTQIKA